VDFVGWHRPPARFTDHPVHAHNRLISSVVLAPPERREVARAISARLAQATGPSVFLLPVGGYHEWDRPGAPLRDEVGIAAFAEEMRATCPATTRLVQLDAHINDAAFAEAALAVIDGWIAEGRLRA
jgi:uncharacterized protein (UPF0261 family)